jgi:ABC-type polysaccharide/polyol phosphate export permease
MPDFSSYVPILVLTLLLTLLAYQAYQKASPQITDEL